MAEVKWIKISTSMFDDEKIDFIESLPECDAILVIWIKLLTLAGKCNAGGYILLTENIPYTDEMLAHKFRRPLNTVKMALDTLRKLGMIQSSDNVTHITNWTKHQNIEGLDKIREQTRVRVARHREKEKLLTDGNVTSNDTVTQGNETDIDIDKEIDKDIIYRKFKHLSITQKEFAKLIEDGYTKEEIDEELDSIENYSKNKNYTNLNLTVRKWLKKNKQNKPTGKVVDINKPIFRPTSGW